jgi:hypothetical protein
MQFHLLSALLFTFIGAVPVDNKDVNAVDSADPNAGDANADPNAQCSRQR